MVKGARRLETGIFDDHKTPGRWRPLQLLDAPAACQILSAKFGYRRTCYRHIGLIGFGISHLNFGDNIALGSLRRRIA